MEVVWKFFLKALYLDICPWSPGINSVFQLFFLFVTSSNLGPGNIIKRLKGAFLMPNQNIDAFSGFLVHQGTK